MEFHICSWGYDWIFSRNLNPTDMGRKE